MPPSAQIMFIRKVATRHQRSATFPISVPVATDSEIAERWTYLLILKLSSLVSSPEYYYPYGLNTELSPLSLNLIFIISLGSLGEIDLEFSKKHWRTSVSFDNCIAFHSNLSEAGSKFSSRSLPSYGIKDNSSCEESIFYSSIGFISVLNFISIVPKNEVL